MNRLHGRWLPLAVLVVASTALVASVAWATGRAPAGGGRWGPPASMTAPAVPGSGPVRSLAAADRAAGTFADRWGLHAGEVMQFDNNFYAELLDPAGNRATEVLVDPASGAVGLEPGPAMMWNTDYGMMRPAPAPAAVTAQRARWLADQWLHDNQPGLHAGDPELFPGYYTLHALRGDRVAGMLSVNAATGTVWYHTWHGRFIAMQEAPGER
jgi:hypothetical protein